MSKICYHCYVSGLVQGVWYRATTKEQANIRNLKGWVRNLADGRVEVMICGEQSQVESLYNWLWQGPPAAQVKHVNCEKLPWQEFTEFNTLGIAR